MLLTVDIGNTQIEVGGCQDGAVLFTERLSTDKKKTALEYAALLRTVFALHKIQTDTVDGAIISSVVPPLTIVFSVAIRKLFGQEPLIVGPGLKSGVKIHIDDPKQLGADLVVDAAGGIALYGAPLIIIDMGTATTLSVIGEENTYLGGMILPGMGTSLKALVETTAQLPDIGLQRPERLIGTNTVDCMRSGIFHGQVAMLDGLIDRICEEMDAAVPSVATGGLASLIVPLCRHTITLDKELMMKGLFVIYEKNRRAAEKKGGK